MRVTASKIRGMFNLRSFRPTEESSNKRTDAEQLRLDRAEAKLIDERGQEETQPVKCRAKHVETDEHHDDVGR